MTQIYVYIYLKENCLAGSQGDAFQYEDESPP